MTPQVKIVHAQFPRQFLYLLNQKPEDCVRYKVGYGGRGGMKSYAFADGALIRGAKQFERVLCARETMNSLQESVHQLLEQRIRDLGLQRAYEVQKSTILGPKWQRCEVCFRWDYEPPRCKSCKMIDAGRTEFIFAGLRETTSNKDAIKSLEGATIVWVEEAAGVSKSSWDKLDPTVRWQDAKAGRKAEIWVSFNPDLGNDETYKRFVLAKPPSAIVTKTYYYENPWLPEDLAMLAAYAKENNPRDYRHIWLGEPKTEVEGAVFSEQLRAADTEGRIMSLPVDKTKPVDCFWDLGYGDTNAIWFMQPVGGWFHVVDYDEGHAMTVADWSVRLQQRGYVYGTMWLPHDGVDALLHRKLTGDNSKSVEMVLRDLGWKVRVAPKLAVNDRINAARLVFPQCRFDQTRCTDGLQGLRHYQWAAIASADKPPEKASGGERPAETRPTPLHNWASHPADAFCTLAVAAKHPARQETPKKPPPRPVSAWS